MVNEAILCAQRTETLREVADLLECGGVHQSGKLLLSHHHNTVLRCITIEELPFDMIL